MSIEAKAVKELRDRTGAGFMECKAALIEAEGDLKRAEEVLRRRGLARAERFAKRETKAGRIGCYVHHNGRLAAMVELLCETDFVAETAEFKELLADLCKQVVGAAPLCVSKEDLPAEILEREKARIAEETRGKPPEVAAKIMEGKLERSVYAQYCLLHQPFIDTNKFAGTVAERIKVVMSKVGENITVRRFARFELGV
jgi:elongation factor Ts